MWLANCTLGMTFYRNPTTFYDYYRSAYTSSYIYAQNVTKPGYYSSSRSTSSWTYYRN